MIISENLTIDDVHLSNRTYNCLKKHNLYYLKEISELSFIDIKNLKGMGETSAHEIFDIINSNAAFFDNDYFISPIGIKIPYNFLNYARFVKTSELSFNNRASNVIKLQNIDTLYELINAKLFDFPGIGKGTIENITSVIKLCIKDISIEFNKNSISKELLLLPISDLPFYSEIVLIAKNKKSVGELYNLFLNDLTNVMRFENRISYFLFKTFFLLKNRSVVDINTLIKNRINENKIGTRAIDIFEQRGLGVTLETLGVRYKVERERIRQIDKKTLLKIRNFWQTDHIMDFFGNRDYFNLKSNDTQLENELFKALFIRLDELSDYVHISTDSLNYMFKKNYYENQLKLFDKINNRVQDEHIVNLCDVDISDINTILFEYFCEINKFEIVDSKFIVRKNAIKRDNVSDYIKNKGIIDLSKENIKKVIREFSSLYGIGIESERAFRALVADVSYSIGNGKYTYLDNNPIISNETLIKLFDEINSKKYVKATVLYSKYKSEIRNLLSPTHLYCFFKRFYSSKFSFGGTNLVIAALGTKTSNSARVYEMLKNASSPINGTEIMLSLGIGTIALSIIESQNEDIIRWGKGKYYLKSKITIDEKSKDTITVYLNKTNEFKPKDLLVFSKLKALDYIKNNYIVETNDMISFIENEPEKLFKEFEYDDKNCIYHKKKNQIGCDYSLDFEI